MVLMALWLRFKKCALCRGRTLISLYLGALLLDEVFAKTKDNARMQNQSLIDPFGRHIDYLRISVTDRCDFRCTYCMAEDMVFTPRNQLLSLEELSFIGETFVHLGVKRVRITGGEPLIRRGVDLLVGRLSAIDPDLDVCMTTNGNQLERYAESLKAQGLKRLNVSLDTLNPGQFRALTRTGDLNRVLAGLSAAKRAGFERIKLNCVALKNQNDDALIELVAYAIKNEFDISFIEEMPLGNTTAHDLKGAHLSSQSIREILSRSYRLRESHFKTGGPSRYWSVSGSRSKIGFISPHSHNFCDTCNRVRLTAEGRLLLCLGNEHSLDLRDVVRRYPFNRERLVDAIFRALTLKPEKHHFDLNEPPQILRFMNTTGG